MKKRLICMLLSVLMIVSLFAGTSVSASAETVSYSTMTYRMASGDYVLRICQRLGLNYYVCKTAIMKLNNIQEGQWNKLPVGKLLTLPSTDADAVVITTGHGSTAKTTTTAATTTAATTIASTTPTNATVSASSSGDPIWFWIVPYELRTGETIADAMNVLGMDSNSFRDSIQKINKIKDWGSSRTETSILLPTYYPPSSNFSRITVYAHVMRAGETPANVVAARGLNYTKIKPMLDILNEKYGGVANVQTGQRLFYPIATTGAVYGKGADGTYSLLSDINSADGTVEFYVDGSRVFSAKKGTTVKYVLKPAKGKAVKDIVLKFANGQADMFLTGDSFTMPSCDVRLSASFQSGHSITIQPADSKAAARIDGVNVSSAAKGARVMVVSTDPSQEIKELYVNYMTLTGAKREQVTNIDQGFVMPDYDVTIEVVLGPVQTYNLFVIDDGVNDARIGQAINANGKFSLQVNDVKVTSAARGTEVKIVFEPDPGYTVGAVWVFNHNANVPVGVFNNTFTMPNRDVDVGVRFDPKGNNILINPVEGGQFYVTLNAADPNPSTIANRNANAVDEAQTNQRVFINWVPEVAGGPYAMSNVPDDFVVTRNSDGLRIPVTVDANGVWFRMPAGGATVTGGVVPAAQTYTARVYLDGVLIPNGQFKDVSFYTKGDNAAERSEFRDGSGVEFKTNQATVATTVGEYIKLTYNGGEHVGLIRYEVWDAAEANMLAEETNQANKSDHCFKMPGQNVVIRAYFSSNIVKINRVEDIKGDGAGLGTVGVVGRDPQLPVDANTPWISVGGVKVGEPFGISLSAAAGRFFDAAQQAQDGSKLRVLRKDNGGEVQMITVGDPNFPDITANPAQGNDGEWIYFFDKMPDCGVKVEVVFDKVQYWLQLNAVDEAGNQLNAGGEWAVKINNKEINVENIFTDIYANADDTILLSLSNAGSSKYSFVNSIINNVTSKDTTFKLSGELMRAAETLNAQGQPLTVTVVLRNKSLTGTKNPIKLVASYNAAGRGNAGFTITQFSPNFSPRNGVAAPDPTALVTEAYAGDTVAVVPQPVTPAKYRVSRIRVNYNSTHYEDLDLNNPVDIGGQNGYTFVMPEKGYSSIVVDFTPVLYNLTVNKTPTDASKGLFQVSYNDGTSTSDVLLSTSFKQVPYGSTVKITLLKPATDAKITINGITITPDTDGSAAASKKPTTDPATTYTFTMPAEDTTVMVNLANADDTTKDDKVPRGDPDPAPMDLPSKAVATMPDDSTQDIPLQYFDKDGNAIAPTGVLSGTTVKVELQYSLKDGEKFDGPIVIKDKSGNTLVEVENGGTFEVPYTTDTPMEATAKVAAKQYKITIAATDAKPSDCKMKVTINGVDYNVTPGTTLANKVAHNTKITIDASDAGAGSKRDIKEVQVNGTKDSGVTGLPGKTASNITIAPTGVEDGGAVTVNVVFKVDEYTLTDSTATLGAVEFYDSDDNKITTGKALDGDTVTVKGVPTSLGDYATEIEVTIGSEAAKTVADGASIVVTGNVDAKLTKVESKEVSVQVEAKYADNEADASSRIEVSTPTTGLKEGDTVTIKVPSGDGATIAVTPGTGYTVTPVTPNTEYKVEVSLTADIANGDTITVPVTVTKPSYSLPTMAEDGQTALAYYSAAGGSPLGYSVLEGTEVYVKATPKNTKYVKSVKIGTSELTKRDNGTYGAYVVTANVSSVTVETAEKTIKLVFDYVGDAAGKVALNWKGGEQHPNTSFDGITDSGSVKITEVTLTIKESSLYKFETVTSDSTGVTVTKANSDQTVKFEFGSAFDKVQNGAEVHITVNVGTI